MCKLFTHNIVFLAACSLDYRSLPLGSLGDLNKGESAGLLVSVKSGELDIGLGYIADTYGRSQELSFSNPLIRYT